MATQLQKKLYTNVTTNATTTLPEIPEEGMDNYVTTDLPEGYYQELTDYKVDLPPVEKGKDNPTRNGNVDDNDYHDSVVFENTAVTNATRDIQPRGVSFSVTEPVREANKMKCNCRRLLLLFSGVTLFLIMIAIIAVLASHLVTDNDEQERKLAILTDRLSNYKKEGELSNKNYEKKFKDVSRELNNMVNILNSTGGTQNEVNSSSIHQELKKLQDIISEIHCGVCKRKPSTRLVQGYVCDCQQLTVLRDCREYYQNGFRTNGIYKVHQQHRDVISVYCDQSTEGGGWTVFQRRKDGSVNFDVNWETYRAGFGHPDGEQWLGNYKIFTMTLQGEPQGNELRIEMEDWDGLTAYATYSSFKVGPERENFKLEISGYSGTGGNSLLYHNDMAFTTKDKDNDLTSRTNCADYHNGGWWFNNCAKSNLNGEYGKRTVTDTGIFWQHFKGMRYSLKSCEMKMRRKIT